MLNFDSGFPIEDRKSYTSVPSFPKKRESSTLVKNFLSQKKKKVLF
jgi:hypothetical protein